MTDANNVSLRPADWLAAWWPLLLGLLVLYVPTYYSLSNGIWADSDSAHGPIVLAIILWLFWQQWHTFTAVTEQPRTGAGLALLIPGLLLYVLGRSQDIMIFEVGSQIPVLMGAILLCHGRAALRAYLFPILFLLFLVPLPGFVVDSLTGTLKEYVSIIVDDLLYLLGFPIARSGVTLMIGPYQLLVADACSGINSMFSLSAIGLLYMYLRGGTSKLHNALLLAAILPIAFVANIGRVIALVLITYYLGDEAGQGFAHDFASITEFMIAVLVLLGVDFVLAKILAKRGAHAGG